jgi:hypothetical protein
VKRVARSPVRTSVLLALSLSLVTRDTEGQVGTANPPAAVLNWLQRTGCQVHRPAQGPLDDRPPPKSLISGRFRGSARQDWAVLCIHRDSSLLLVFPGGQADVIDTVEMGVAPTRATRRIYTGPPSEVRMYVTSLPNEDIEPADTVWMTRDGIVDAVDCCGVVWYWHGGSWRRLPGPD